MIKLKSWNGKEVEIWVDSDGDLCIMEEGHIVIDKKELTNLISFLLKVKDENN